MIITKEFLSSGASWKGAWSERQVRLLGEKKGTHNNKGWKDRVIGRNISDANAEEFLRLKDQHLTSKKADIEEWIQGNKWTIDDYTDVVDVDDLKEFFSIQ